MKNNAHISFLSFVLFMWLNGNNILAQTTRNVPSQYSTVQAAIDAATNGDTVLVANGTYYEEVNFKGKLVKLISKNGPENTIIEALDGRFFRGVKFESGENSSAVISGFSIRKFSQYGIYCENSSPTIQNNIIHNNTEAGVYCYGASPIIVSNVIKNEAIHPQQQNGIVALNGSNPQIYRNLILNNTEEGVQLATAGAQIVNNTLVNNLASGIEINGAIPAIINNVIVGNGNSTGIKNISSPPGNPAFNYNDVWNNASNYFNCSPGAGSISTSPLFVNPNSSDYHLQSVSPCIDAGNPASPLDPDGTRADMGAFYFHQGTTESFTDISAPLLGVFWSSCAWGDYDNDGDLDILLAGQDSGGNKISKVYRNDGGRFTDIGASLEGVNFGTVAWGDYDNDGDLDILLTGNTGTSAPVSKVYRNESGSFADIGASLIGVFRSSVAWGDYDNDGDLDILLTGESKTGFISKIYRNDKGTFVDIADPILIGVRYGSVAWGDYDKDGDLDILLTGGTTGSSISKIFQNDNGSFVDTAAPIVGVGFSSVEWGDYDNDGDLDILLTGYRSGVIFKIYRNDPGNFVDASGPLNNILWGTAAWGDYDNDGDLDVLLTGTSDTKDISTIYRNDGGSFVDVSVSLANFGQGASVDWGDYDNDGDLDILFTGGGIAKIYRNNISTANTVPTPSSNLTFSIAGNAVTLSWNKTTDKETAQNALTYNLRVGTTPGGSEIVSPMANVSTGYRKIPQLGNTNHNARWTIKNLPAGKYYWSVQAIDNAFAGSPFAGEQSFVIGGIDQTPPAAPQGLTASAGDRQITLKWRQNTEADFLRYRIYRGTSPNPITKVDSTNGIADTSKTFAGLINGTRYYFRITAVDQNLNESGYSNEVSAIPIGDQFTKITTGPVVTDGGDSRGCAWADYDNDGDLDLLVTNREQNNVLYSNNGNGTFTKITQSVIFTDGGNSRGISWGDYDNDGYIDIFIGNQNQKNYLYHNNGNGVFSKITTGPVANDQGIAYNVSWGDYDNDGDLDLFVANCCGQNNFLYSNNGNGTFTKITQGAIVNDGGNSISANWVDYDNDGDLDLFVANADNQKNFLYTNNSAGTFTKITQGAIVNDQATSWGSSWGDYDNDGDLDLFVANIDNQNDFLYTNNGDGTFTKVTTGDIVNDGGVSFGSGWGDYDNDGDLDLFVAYGYQNNALFSNNGDGTFTKITAGVIVNEGSNSGSCAWGDYDNDGDLDLFVAKAPNLNNLLYSNNGNTNRWINIKCVGTVSNASAIGAKIRVKAQIKGKPVWQMQEISGQTGNLSQNSLNAEFGLGDATQIDSIKIEWPSKIVQVLVNVPVNQFLTITEPSDKPLPPRNLRATAGDRQITLTWTANSEADFLRYRIYGGTSPNPTAIVDSVQGSANTSKTLTGLSNGTTYFYRLTAVDQALNASGFSNEVSAMPSATDLPPAPPQNLVATTGVAQITLTWNANTETDFLRYRIYGGTAANPTTKIDSVEGAANTSKIIANLTPGTTYYFRLTAVDRAMHASGFSNIATAAPVADKTAPVLGSAAYARTANLNSEVQVAISVSDVSGVKNVSVHYRAGGAASFSSKPMLWQSGSTYSQTIPAAAVTNRGVEFYVRAEDTYGNVAQTGLHPIRVYCPNGIANPAVQPSGKEASLYRLFSIPLELDNPSPATFLSANPSLGAYDDAKYRWYGLERASQSLREYPNFGSMAMTPDMGFALLVNIRNVKLKTSSGTTVVTSTPYNISLPAGWSLIGNPFNFNIPFDSLRVSFGTFELWSFEGDWQINTRGLEPWKGYAIWLSDAATFSIRPGVAGLNNGTAFYSVANNDAENWLLQIIADNGRSTSRFNFAGQSAGATDNEDALDLHQPVRLADRIEVVFTKKNSASLKADIRQPSSNGHTWEFTCRLNPEDEVLSLTFDGVATVPPAFDIFLLEPETARAYDLRANPRLQFATRRMTEKRFQLIAGTKAYLQEQALPAELHPTSFELLQNFPNPFNPSTQIIYSLPEASHVEVSVYNIRGEVVATLVNERQASGSHSVVWNAEKVGSGVYFIKMRAGRVERMRKCVFVK